MKQVNCVSHRKKCLLLLLLLLTLSLLCTSCGPNGSKPYYECSPRADGSGGVATVVDVTIPRQCVEVTDPNVVTFAIGMGSNWKPELYPQMTAILRIKAEGCLINGTEDVLEIEYPRCFDNEDFRPTVEENRWTYPALIPNFYEDVEITFPTGEFKGIIYISLYVVDPSLWPDNTNRYPQGGLLERAKIDFYYASNGTVIWFSDKSLSEVDEDNRPVRVKEDPYRKGFIS